MQGQLEISREDVLEYLNTILKQREYVMIYMAIYTGMRKGELLGLTWSNVDLSRRILYVKQQLQYIGGKGYIYMDLKTPKSKRQIPITTGLLTLLKEVRKGQAQDKLLAGSDYEDNDLVFCLENGKPLNPNNLTKISRRILH